MCFCSLQQQSNWKEGSLAFSQARSNGRSQRLWWLAGWGCQPSSPSSSTSSPWSSSWPSSSWSWLSSEISVGLTSSPLIFMGQLGSAKRNEWDNWPSSQCKKWDWNFALFFLSIQNISFWKQRFIILSKLWLESLFVMPSIEPIFVKTAKSCKRYTVQGVTLGVGDTLSDSIQCLNFAKKWFNSIQIIIALKINSDDSIQKIIQFNSQGIIDTGQIRKKLQKVSKTDKRRLSIKNWKYWFNRWFIHSFHDKIQFKRLFDNIFSGIFNSKDNPFLWKIQFKN